MGRHRTPEEKRELGERARQLRAAGRSRREIQAELGIGDDLAKQLLRGVALPDRLRRPQAKDALREQARHLRSQGATYDQIAAKLNVSKSSCSLWLRDLPQPTVRQNVGEDYRGCLCICVLQGRELYRVQDGLVEGLATGRRDIEQWHDDVDVLSRST